MPRNLEATPDGDEISRDLDMRALIDALKRRRRTIIGVTLAAFVGVGLFVNVVSPRYMAESQVLLENQETFFTRPDRTAPPSEQNVDPEAVGSQVQLITSRDLASRAVKALHLQGNPEFDPSARGISAIGRVLVLLGLSRNPSDITANERMARAFQEKLTVYSPPKTRVIAIQFQSKDPDLAARGANEIADLYISEQSNAKRETAKEAAQALSGQITDLRAKLAKADADREAYRAEYGLLAGNNNMTISGQQLADINGDLSRARSTQADAQAKAGLLRELIRAGKTADVPDVVNNDLVRRVSEQRVTAQAQLAQESRTLLPGHPRIKELAAQVAGLDAALKAAAKQAASTLENEARIAHQRVENLETVLAQQKKAASTANFDEVRLRSLDRIAQSFKDQLDSSTTKYQEALARQTSNATPADARVIARAVPPQEPIYPKKAAFMAFGTIAAFVFAVGLVLAAEMLKAPVIQTAREADDMPVVPVGSALQAKARVRLDAAPVMRRAPVVVRGQTNGWKRFVKGLMAFGQSAAQSRETDPPLTGAPLADAVSGLPDRRQPDVAPTEIEPAVDTPADIHALVTRIVAGHVPGRGLHIVATHLETDVAPADDVIVLGRRLSAQGRTVLVDLNADPAALAGLASAGHGDKPVRQLAGLSELLSGGSSFAEVIHRDHASRLHFIPSGLREADFRDFDLILDALSETYDFIVLLAPALNDSEIAKVMAPYAQVVVLGGVRQASEQALLRAERDMIEAGARDVLMIGRVPRETRDQATVA